MDAKFAKTIVGLKVAIFGDFLATFLGFKTTISRKIWILKCKEICNDL